MIPISMLVWASNVMSITYDENNTVEITIHTSMKLSRLNICIIVSNRCRQIWNILKETNIVGTTITTESIMVYPSISMPEI